MSDKVAFEVRFNVLDGCGEFSRFIDQREGNTIKVRVEAKHTGCICTQNMPEKVALYNFRPSRKGTFVFDFSVSGTDDAIDTLLVR